MRQGEKLEGNRYHLGERVISSLQFETDSVRHTDQLSYLYCETFKGEHITQTHTVY